ncbi:MAG TPA: hypothetical protein VF614_01365 [Chthoniobacteraceae bacterium]
MIEQVGNAITFHAFFTESKIGKSGLTVTIDVYRGATLVVTAGSATAIGGGLYSYTLASGSVTTEAGYTAIFKTATTTVDQQHIPALWTVGTAGVENLNAPVADVPAGILATPSNKLATDASGRTSANIVQVAGQTANASAAVTFPASIGTSTFAGGAVASVAADVGITQAGADKVWSTSARSLTTFGTLVSDIWGATGRTLTAISDSTGVGTLLTRLSALRAGYLDKLNVAGALAQAGDAMALTPAERTATANEVEAQIIDDTDPEKVLQAITDKIASVNPSLGGLTLGAIASAVWANNTRSLSEFGFSVTVATNNDKTGYALAVAAPTAAQNATAVRAELALELGRIDTTIGSRMATFAYTAPNENVATAATRILSMLELQSGSTYRFTAGALINAPAGEGGGGSVGALTPEQQAQLDTIEAHTALISPGGFEVRSPVTISGNKISVTAGDSWSIPFTALGSLVGAQKVWFALKKRISDTDEDAVLFVDLTGLNTLNAEDSSDAALASLTIEDATVGNLRLDVDEAATLEIPAVGGFWAVKTLTATGNAVTLASGPFSVSAGTVLAIA